MRIEVKVEGVLYASKEITDEEANKASQQHYDGPTSTLAGLRMELDTGGFLVLGEYMCERAIFVYK